MERFQTGLFESTAAAAGCKVADYNFDDGVDVGITHRVNGPQDEVKFNFQLKCTTRPLTKNNELPVRLSRKRFDEMRGTGKTFPFILVAHQVPKDIDDWIANSLSVSELRHKSYWLNLTGMTAGSGTGDIIVNVPTINTFDDSVLVDMIAKHRVGMVAL